MTLSEKVAYIKGLDDGLNIDAETSKEGKLVLAIIDILKDVGMSIEDLEETTEALGRELDDLSDDLADVEEFLMEEDDEEDDEDDEEEEEEDADGCCCCEDDEDFFEVECPNCEETLVIDQDVLGEGVIQCPNCKEKFSLDLSDEHCDCGCEDSEED